MCGLAGILTHNRDLVPDLDQAVRIMAETLSHRGPDDDGTWVDDAAGIALGFKRLSIIDLSQMGRQPMRSASGRYVAIFNGEIYNHLALRRELADRRHGFRGQSDTEVLLAAFDEWGLVPAIRRCNGMFALAVWDTRERTLFLIRDRLGIKPLFVGRSSGVVTFGSELKALMAAPGLDRGIDSSALAAYLRYLYVPAPASIFRSVTKLLPGHIMTIRDPSAPLPPPVAFWSLEEVARQGLAQPLEERETDLIERAEDLLESSVRMRLQADVPVGALLSGGIDSTLVVSTAQTLSSQPVNTYSVAFEEEDYNEAPHAAKVAEHLGTRHTEITLTPDETLDLIPSLPEILDEPFASPSAIPNFLVCRLARSEVTVALSGTGGDEIFAGYNRYTRGARLLRLAARTPASWRDILARTIRSVPADRWDRVGQAPLLPRALRYRYPGRKAIKIAELLAEASPVWMYRSLVSAWQDPEEAVPSASEFAHALERILASPIASTSNSDLSADDLVHRCLLADQLTYLTDDQLAKVDRVSMAVSLELRVPLLDHRLVELSWRLPLETKVRGGEGKWILRRLAHRRVPRELLDRPKMGLSVPIERWMKGPLRDWAEALLDRESIEADGTLNAPAIHRRWEAFQAGEGGLDLGLWAVLMYAAWRERWGT